MVAEFSPSGNAPSTGPLWQNAYPGVRVRPRGECQQGEVEAVLDETPDGIPKRVLVEWDHEPTVEARATDGLEILELPPGNPLFAGMAESAVPWLQQLFGDWERDWEDEYQAISRLYRDAAVNPATIVPILDELDAKIEVAKRLKQSAEREIWLAEARKTLPSNDQRTEETDASQRSRQDGLRTRLESMVTVATWRRRLDTWQRAFEQASNDDERVLLLCGISCAGRTIRQLERDLAPSVERRTTRDGGGR